MSANAQLYFVLLHASAIQGFFGHAHENFMNITNSVVHLRAGVVSAVNY